MSANNPEGVQFISHRDLFRDTNPVATCWYSGKLSLTTRLAHRAVRLMRRRGAPGEVGHYRCRYCLARHITSMPRHMWPPQTAPNSPAQWAELDVA